MKQPVREDYNLVQSIRNSFLPAAGGLVIANPFLASVLYAAPQGGQVIAGQADIHHSNNNTVIHQQSNRAVINWNSFNINANESVTFVQPGTSSAVLNRIVNQNPTTILGKLNANGQVFLINPNGVVFGKTARINVGGIVASSLNIKTDDFMNGRYVFTHDSKKYPGKVINKGLIKAASSGVAMIGSNVMNEGRIYARLGNVAMLSAEKVTVDFDGDGLIQFEINRKLIEKDRHIIQAVSNTGQIIADGGNVILSASTAKDVFSQVVNNEGVIKASRIQKQGGDVFLIGGSSSDIVNTGEINVTGSAEAGNILLQGESIDVTGRLLADSKNSTAGTIIIKAEKVADINAMATARGLKENSKAGQINVTGDKIKLKSGTNMDVSGFEGGGEVLVGGNYQGKGELKTADKTRIDKGSSINADAVIRGKGGKVIIWSDNKTTYKGRISAKGGKQMGDGGFVEVSGKKKLNFKGEVDTSAEDGNNGILLLDPEYIKVAKGDGTHSYHPDTIYNWVDSDILYNDQADESITITEEQLESINSDIILQASVGIEFEKFELELDNNLTIETRNDISLGDDQKQTNKIHGIDISLVDIKLNNGDLILQSGQNSILTGQDDPGVEIKLGKIETSGSLSVASSGKLIINESIQSGSDVLLVSGSNNLQTTSNVVIESTGSSVTLNGKLNSTGNSINVNAFTEVNLEEVEAEALTAQSDKLNLSSDITTVNSIDFSAVNAVQLNADISLSSGQNIDVSNGISGVSNTLNIAADNISLGATQLEGLNVQADTLNISGDLNLGSALSLTSVNTMQVTGTRTIDTSSVNGNINFQQTQVQGDDLNLDSGSGNIYLGQVSLERLSLIAQQAHLYNNITTRYQLDLNNISTLVLQNDLTLSSIESSLNLGADINGSSYDLILDADTINLSGINTGSLNINRDGSQIFLSGDISTLNSINFADNSTLTLLQNSQIKTDGDIKLAEQISGSYVLKVDSQSGDLNIGQVSVEELLISSQGQARLSGNITTINDMDFSSAVNIQLIDDVVLESGNKIDLRSDINSSSFTLGITADRVDLKNMDVLDLNINTSSLYLSGGINSFSSLDFANVNTVYVSGNVELNTASNNNNIDFSASLLQGDNLILNAGNGNIQIGRVLLESLKIYANNGYLYDDIDARYLLDFNNVTTVVLENSITLMSEYDTLKMETEIVGNNYDLILDADNVHLNDLDVRSLDISRVGGDINLSGDINVQKGLDFAANTNLEIHQDTQVTAENNIYMADTVTGNYQLDIISNNGDIHLGNIDINELLLNANNVFLDNSIKTHKSLIFSNVNVNLTDNVNITSYNGSIVLSNRLDANNHSLELDAKQLEIYELENLYGLDATTDQLLVFNDISATNSINFSAVQQLSLNNNLNLEATDFIYLPDNLDSTVAGLYSLTLFADKLQINRLGSTGKELNNIQANAQVVKVSNAIRAKGVIDFKQVDKLLTNGTVTLDTSSGNSNILLSATEITGDELILNSGAGDINIGLVNLSGLNVTADNLNLYDNVNALAIIDLSNVDIVTLFSDVSLSSSNIDLKSQVSGVSYNLILNADNISLGRSGDTLSLNSLNVGKTNSNINLYASLDLLALDFAENTTMLLQDDVTITTLQHQVHAENITGGFALNLINSGDRIELNKVEIDSLNVANSGVTHFYNDITTISDLVILSSSDIELKNDVNVMSNNASIKINSDINGNNYELNIQSDRDVMLSDVDVNKLNVKATSLKLSGRKIHALNSINLEKSNVIEVNQDIKFSTDITGQLISEIRINDIKSGNNHLNLSFLSDTVSLGSLDKGSIPESIKVSADTIYLNKDLSVRKNIELNSSNIYLNDNVVIKSDSGLLELSGSRLYGNLHNLTLQNSTGNINVGRVDNVNNLYVYTPSSVNLTAPVNSYLDQDYRGVNNLNGNTIDLYSTAGTIYLNNTNAHNLNVSSQNSMYLYGKINTDNEATLLSRAGSVNMMKNAEIYGGIINLKAQSNVLVSFINGRDMRIESTNGSLIAIPTGHYNIKGDTVRINVKNNIGSFNSPLYVNVNRLIIESATNAVINGIFKYQEIQGDTYFTMPELEFLALIKGYYLDLDEFKTIDSSIFLMGVNLFSVADDAVNVDEDLPGFYSESQNLNNHMTMN